jgi:hypothetical protein
MPIKTHDIDVMTCHLRESDAGPNYGTTTMATIETPWGSITVRAQEVDFYTDVPEDQREVSINVAYLADGGAEACKMITVVDASGATWRLQKESYED